MVDQPLPKFSLTPHGFRWGVAEAQCTAVMKDGTVVITVKRETNEGGVDIYVSPGGRSIRAFVGGYQLRK